ncbi:somatomedin-B and thrombospondin type-1 domain-containing protein-like [Trichogramma pretiosum]|uniref:somatomedin-B and thrombospondin type-1 domain-containing protein-like n=1 Tax=Trichogramma pretiosum TaxID=7493 RepID=UPI000C71BBE3|nr:somatomedin-B and thrombospondin type-1 domain-containing protein-like [Trichogramma pretiosum]XP_023313649.1 somatomedin-B and thrombospondin type-1 domain-containing protein-like [Trichogramma pretiosum]XP_023313650.1 somatomedin-B and thrombospondin type-1 domain-containing protein-like [Trichogramma pretiosum]
MYRRYESWASSSMVVLLTWVCLMWLGHHPAETEAGSCRAAKLCCQGRDSGCVIQKAAPNAIIESPRDKPCYCDHACLRLADCCSDFNETCIASDCLVGDWSAWSACDNRCGTGSRSRARLVLAAPRNGGKACPTLEERADCESYDRCRRRSHHFYVQDTSSFSTSSKSAGAGARATVDDDDVAAGTSNDNDVASLHSNFVPRVSRGYCTAFTVLKVSKGCRRKYFHEGFRVCVWCGGGGGSNASGTSSSSSSSNSRPKETSSTTTASSCQLDRRSLRGIGRWELRGSTAEGLKHCHGKWIADDAELLEEEEEEEVEDLDDDEYAEEETVEYCRTSAKCRDRPVWSFL